MGDPLYAVPQPPTDLDAIPQPTEYERDLIKMMWACCEQHCGSCNQESECRRLYNKSTGYPLNEHRFDLAVNRFIRHGIKLPQRAVQC